MAKSEFSQYLAEIGRFPVLSKESQLRHCQRINRWMNYSGGKDQAPRHIQRSGRRSMDAMVKTNLRLVVNIAKKYAGKGVAIEDLIQEGNIGLIRGLELFDPSRGYQVSTYCYWWIFQGVSRAVHSHGRTIRMPINTHEMLVKIHRFQVQILNQTGDPPTVEAIAEHLNQKPERIRDVLRCWEITNVGSLDAKAKSSDDELGASVIDLIPNPRQTTENDPTEYLLSEAGNEKLKAAINDLTEIEQKIIKGQYEDGRSQRHIGEELNISRARVGQVQQRAIRKLRLAMNA